MYQISFNLQSSRPYKATGLTRGVRPTKTMLTRATLPLVNSQVAVILGMGLTLQWAPEDQLRPGPYWYCSASTVAYAYCWEAVGRRAW